MLGKSNSAKTGHTLGLFYIPRITRENGVFTSDANGYIFTEFFRIIAEEHGTQVPEMAVKQPDTMANHYVRNYAAVFILKTPDGENICYSVNYRNQLPSALTDRLRRVFELMPDDTVLWSDDVFKEPQSAPAREVLYGERPEKPPKRETRAAIQKRWAHPQALDQNELDYLNGKRTEPPRS